MTGVVDSGNDKNTGSIGPRFDIARTLKIALYIFGCITVFFYFFSFIGILIGIGFIVFSRDKTWKLNGAVLSFAVAFSAWVSNIGIELAPLKLAAATGPPIIIVYFAIRFFIARKNRSSDDDFAYQDFKPSSWKPAFRKIITVVAVIIPIFMWQWVSMDYGVFLDNSPQLLWVHAPTTVQSGKYFNFTVQCWDPYERLSALYKGTVAFEIESYDLETTDKIDSPNAMLPCPYTFSGQERGSCIAYEIKDGKDNGRKDFLAVIETPGIHYIKVRDLEAEKTYYSNPILVGGYQEEGYGIYWGDIHTHSSLSDGSGSLDHNTFYAREIACLDFMGLTDHAEILLWKPGVYGYIENKINQVNTPGVFVMFQGFEWTQTADGHYSIIFSGDRLLKNVNYLNTPKPPDLWSKLDEFTVETGTRALALPHHTTKKEYIQDWTYINPKYVKIAEVASTHGNFLFEPWDDLNYEGAINPPAQPQNGTCIMDAIMMGHKLVLYAASDSHDGFPGHTLSHTDAHVGHQRPFSIWLTRNDKPYSGGLTAVYASSLTREDIFEGLEDQRIYASSDYGRPYLDFSINGLSIRDGNEVGLDTLDSMRELDIVFAQDGAYSPQKYQSPIDGQKWDINWDAVIEVFKNGRLWRSFDVSSPVTEIAVKDMGQVTGCEYGYEKCIEKNGTYYINEYSDRPVDPDILDTGGTDFYIVRTVTSSGREAYAGPIWVSSK